MPAIKEKNTLKAALKEKTAELTGVSVRSVRRVLAGDQKNEAVMATYMELWERFPLMVEEVKRVVPFYLCEMEALDAQIAAMEKQAKKTA